MQISTNKHINLIKNILLNLRAKKKKNESRLN